MLILGGGVAGSAMAYYLSKKNYEVTVIERYQKVGGLSRTCFYAGHPYEFGPHVWFWPGGPEADINKTIVELTNNELYYIDRKLFTYIEKDKKKYRYPIHFNDIKEMPDKDIIFDQLKKNRNDEWKLIKEKLPTIGNCKFEDYFVSAIGNNLYAKFMNNYSWKMWNISGNELETSMVWADRFKHAYTKTDKGTGLQGYDPLKFEDHTLGKGISFQIYPKNGWNDVWDKMVANANLIKDEIVSIKNEHKQPFILTKNNEKYYFADYNTVFSTLDVDELWGENRLPYTGRIMIPMLFPDLKKAFPEETESLHFASCEFQTRTTEMKMITKHDSPDTLILIEVPILPGSDKIFPSNVLNYSKESNLYAEKAYPQQSEEGFNIYRSYIERGKKINNLKYVGRHAEFKYWGMPETVNSAYIKSKDY